MASRMNSKANLRRRAVIFNHADWDKKRAVMCLSKKSFDSEYEAIAACIRVSREIGPMRYYRCPECGKFHLTTKTDDVCCDSKIAS